MAPSSKHTIGHIALAASPNQIPQSIRRVGSALIAHTAKIGRYIAQYSILFGKPIIRLLGARVQSVSRARPAAARVRAITSVSAAGDGRLECQTAKTGPAVANACCALRRFRLQSTSRPRLLAQVTSGKALANQSLNRTHCGVRPKARHFILGF